MHDDRPRPIARYALIALALTSLPILVRIIIPVHPFIADDAYYYLVVAHNLVTGHGSTFYGHALTNGYHPLWLGVLALILLVFGPALKMIVGLGILLSALTVFTVLWYLRPATVMGAINTAVLVWIPFRGASAFTGMESGLVLFLGSWALLALFLPRRADVRHLAGATVLLILASAARLDFVVLALPALLLAPGFARRPRLIALACYLAAGAVYAVFNRVIFGMALPVSGTIKSLGGLQVNEPFLERSLLTQSWTKAILQVFQMSPGTVVVGVVVIGVALAVCYGLTRHRWQLPEQRAARLALACVIGGALYLVKIVFLSSWVTWGWYGYIAGFLAIAAVLFLQTFVAGAHRRREHVVLWIGVALLVPYYIVANAGIEQQHQYAQLNYDFYASHRHLLATHNVAMGDRAGSLAYFSGHANVFQLEGLVMDRAYRDTVEKPQELTPYLCRHGVDVLIDYEPPLGDYTQHRLPAMRPELTQYHSAYVTVRHADQIARFEEDNVFPPTAFDGDNVIYAWRLDCPRPPAGTRSLHAGR